MARQEKDVDVSFSPLTAGVVRDDPPTGTPSDLREVLRRDAPPFETPLATRGKQGKQDTHPYRVRGYHKNPLPHCFVSVADKGLSVGVSGLESTDTGRVCKY